MAQDKTHFENTTDGYVGVVTLDPRGVEKAIAVEPHGRVWLSPEEQQLTADASKKAESSPFVEHPYTHFDEKTGDVIATGSRPLLVEVTEPRPTPASEGSFAQGEEVGTPVGG